MKKPAYLCLAFLFISVISPTASAFDTKGIQPVQPNGTFSAISAHGSGKDELGVMLSIERSVEPNFFRLYLDTSYGLNDNMDLMSNIPLIFDHSGTEGLEDINLGFKHNVLKEERIGPSISYLLGLSIPGRNGISAEGHYGGGLIVSKRVGPFRGHGNLLYYKSMDSALDDEVELRLGLDLAAAHSFNILSEVLIRSSHSASNDDDLIEGRLGYRTKISSSTYATMGAGYDFRNSNPDLRVFFSLSLLAPVDRSMVKNIFIEDPS